MAMLNDRQIKEYCKKYRMMEPYDESCIKSSSYDLSMGDEYRFSSEDKIRKIGEGGKIKIPPYSLCYILTKESLNLPNNICALILPRNRLVREGVLMYPQPPIEPGSKGRLYVFLHNLSNENRYIEKNEHLASLIFLKLSEDAEKPYGTRDEDHYYEAQTLENLRLGPTALEQYTPALKEISEKIEKWSVDLFSKWIPILLILMTIFLMLLTIMFGWKI